LHGNAAPGDRSEANINAGNEYGRRKSKKEELFDKQMEMYQKERNSGTPQGPPRMR